MTPIKFHTREEAQQFLLELERVDLLKEATTVTYAPPEDLMEQWVRRRRTLVPALKDFRRSQNSKANWRRNRHRYMNGIRRFHDSTQGKKFHRQMSRFLASRDFYSNGLSRKREDYSIQDIAEFLKALSSTRTHLIIEADYYHPVETQVDFEILLEDLLPMISLVETRVLQGEPLSEEHQETVALLVSPVSVLFAIEEQLGVEHGSLTLDLASSPDLTLVEAYRSLLNLVSSK